MTGHRTILSWSMAALLLVTVLGFMLWTPYRPELLQRAIPAGATIITAHDNLAGRYQALATNIFLTPLLNQLPEQWRRPPPHAEKQLARHAHRLAGRKTVTAWMPHTPSTGQPGLILASWTGNYALLIRWHMKRLGSKWERLPSPTGRAVWLLRQPPNTADQWQLALTFGEGMLILFLSPAPWGIHDVIRSYEGLAPATAGFSNLPSAPDRARIYYPIDLSLAVTEISAQRMTAQLRAPLWLPEMAADIKPDDLAPLQSLWGERPDMALFLSPAATRALTHHLPQPYADMTREFTELRPTPDEGPLAMAVLSGAEGGGFGQPPWRISLPALMIARRINSQDDALLIVRRTLDALNANLRWGLIVDPAPLAGASAPIFTIEATNHNLLGQLPPRDRPAYGIVDNWLILTTHAGALAGQLQQPATGAPPRWMEALQPPTAGLLWADMPKACRTLQMVLTALSMRLQHPEQQQALRNVKLARALATGLQTTSTAMLRLATDDPAAYLEIHATQAPANITR
ncbi:MAG: hypothetical protein ABR497_03320 [Kiritimatiellia bacterium]